LRDAVAPKSPPKQRLAKKIPATKKYAKEDKGEKEYHGGQIGCLAGEGRPAVLWRVADIIDRPPCGALKRQAGLGTP
jgi:hypothetical protein